MSRTASRFILFALMTGALFAVAATARGDEAKAAQELDRVKVSEAFGHLIGRNLENPGITFDLEAIVRGMRDGAAGKPAPMSEEEYEEMMAAIQEAAFDELARANLQDADTFMVKNASQPNVVTVDEGKVQYVILKEGAGNAVAEGATPTLHYHGTYLDGTLFGSSLDAGGPVAIPLDQTIPGFAHAVVGMKETRCLLGYCGLI